MALVLDTHPDREKLVEAILAGESLREVARRANVSHTAVQNYVRRVVRPAVRSPRAAVNLLKERPESSVSIEQVRQTVNIAKDAASQSAIVPVMEKIARREARREALLSDAAESKDFRGYASLDSCEYRDLELECRLRGLLDSGPTHQTNIMIVCAGADEQPAETGFAIDLQPADRP